MRLARESVELANAIGELTAGRPRLAVGSALGLVAGAIAADAATPDLQTVMEHIDRATTAEFARRAAELRS
ncbi:MAG: hypothetical protein WAP03_13180 [Methylorubrum rhodinum]|uniref:hypothetical protein n=1 Tax=Methylorubrum rhodinum TaxID=29428 RepID=UPI003BB0775A